MADKLGIVKFSVDTILEKSRHDDKNFKKSQFKDSVFLPNPNFEPEDDEEWKVNCNKAESPVWKELQKYRHNIRTNGLSGKDKRYYQWDHLHNEIEMYDSRGNPIDAIDPKTGERLFKNVSHHKILNL